MGGGWVVTGPTTEEGAGGGGREALRRRGSAGGTERGRSGDGVGKAKVVAAPGVSRLFCGPEGLDLPPSAGCLLVRLAVRSPAGPERPLARPSARPSTGESKPALQP